MDGTPSQPDPDTIKMFVGQVRYLYPSDYGSHYL